MFEDIFGSCPRVKVINYILIGPELEYSISELAFGSGIAKSSLDSFIDEFISKGYLIKHGEKFRVNTHNEYMNILSRTQIELADVASIEASEDFIEDSPLSNNELDEIFDEEYHFDIDYELAKLENSQ